MDKEKMKSELDELSSEELLEIWNTNDRVKYKKEAFPVINEILTERGIEVSPKKLLNLAKGMERDFTEEMRVNNTGNSIAAYFTFEALISATLIRISYFVGMIIITCIGYEVAVKSSQSLIGVSILLFGNLLWRILCETSIIFFRIHESLVSIDKKL